MFHDTEEHWCERPLRNLLRAQVCYFCLHPRTRAVTFTINDLMGWGLSKLNDDPQEQLGTRGALAVHCGLEMNLVMSQI